MSARSLALFKSFQKDLIYQEPGSCSALSPPLPRSQKDSKEESQSICLPPLFQHLLKYAKVWFEVCLSGLCLKSSKLTAKDPCLSVSLALSLISSLEGAKDVPWALMFGFFCPISAKYSKTTLLHQCLPSFLWKYLIYFNVWTWNYISGRLYSAPRLGKIQNPSKTVHVCSFQALSSKAHWEGSKATTFRAMSVCSCSKSLKLRNIIAKLYVCCLYSTIFSNTLILGSKIWMSSCPSFQKLQKTQN